jgi:hypothetical protein
LARRHAGDDAALDRKKGGTFRTRRHPKANNVFNYFYIASGVLLIALAVMYWFGKTHKLRGEYVSIAIRAFVGTGLTFACLSDWYGPFNAQFGFLFSAWHIPIVMVSYFIGTLLLHFENLHIIFNANPFI